jgi:hypothetical protein
MNLLVVERDEDAAPVAVADVVADAGNVSVRDCAKSRVPVKDSEKISVNRKGFFTPGIFAKIPLIMLRDRHRI